MTAFPLVLLGTLLSMIVLTLVWWRQLFTHNAGIVDGWWSYNFGLITLLYVILGPGDLFRKTVILAMVMIWSIRLGTHLLIRNTTHTDEDTRYKKLREEYGRHQHLMMWRFFMYQALSNVLLSAPFLIICLDESAKLSMWVWFGVAIWAIAIAGESIADAQLKRFKKDLSNRGKVCQAGLWNYSRHPNYFFEWLIWLGYAVMAIDSPYGWIALGCPVLMYLLLTKVTGIPMLEDLAVKSKGDAYREYQRTTNAFFPWFKNK